MTLAVCVEPIASGFRASCSMPEPMFADAATAESAVARLRDEAERKTGNCEVRIVKKMNMAKILDLVEQLNENPLFAEVEADIEKERQIQNSKPFPES